MTTRKVLQAARRFEDAMAEATASTAVLTVAAMRDKATTVVASAGQAWLSPDGVYRAGWWQEAVRTRVAAPLRDFVVAAGQAEAVKIGVAFDLVNPLLDRTAARHLAGLEGWADGQSQWVRRTVRKALTDGLSVDDLAAQLTGPGDSPFNPVSARRFAQTELIAAQNGANHATYMGSGLTGTKTWLSSRDDHVRPDHVAADGQTRPVGEPFDVGGWPAQFPAAPELPGSQRYGCRCKLSFIPDEIQPAPPAALVSASVTGQAAARRVGVVDFAALPADDRRVAARWDTGGWRAANRALRGGGDVATTAAGREAAAVAAVTMVNLLYGLAIPAAVSARRWWPKTKAAAAGKAGGVTTSGITSYTLDDTVPAVPDGWVTVELEISAGAHAALLPGKALELLVPPGTKMSVVRVDRDGTVHLRVVSQTYPAALIGKLDDIV